jgi:UDP-2-acetamido-3-amino-2,3-dideoxy-glucuronate N-acetyltransferase
VSARRLRLPAFDDERGRVVPVEHASRDLPFVPARSFVICNVPHGKRRAEHVVSCDEVLVLVSGSVAVIVKEDGREIRYLLDAPGAALHVAAGMWVGLREFARDTVLLVLAAKPYGGAR